LGEQTEVRDFDAAFAVAAQFVVTGKCVVIVRGESPQLRRGRVFFPPRLSPGPFIDPIPPLADAKVEVPIKPSVALRLLTNLKSRIRTPLRPQLVRRTHFEIRCDERPFLITFTP